MDWTPIVLAIITAVVAPIVGASVYAWNKRADARYRELSARIDRDKLQSQRELEQVKSQSAEALAAANAIQSMASAIQTQAEDRKESTAATKENTAALNNVKTVLTDQDARTQLFFRNFTNLVTQFSGEAGQAIRKLEAVVEAAIGALGGKIDGAIPAMVDQVKPLVSEITELVNEIKRVNAVDETASTEKMDRIEGMFQQLVESITRLETTVGQALRPEPPEPAPLEETAATFELEPAGV